MIGAERQDCARLLYGKTERLSRKVSQGRLRNVPFSPWQCHAQL